MYEEANTPDYPRFLPYLICALAALFYVYDFFIQVSPSIMTNELMREFSIGAGELGVLAACFYYSYTLMQIPVGLLIDRFGARRLLTFSVLISGLGVTMFGMTHSIVVVGFSRFCIGFGSAFSFISALYLASRWFSHRYFALVAGLVQTAGCIGSIIGLAPLAAIINHFGWRETMIVTGLFTLLLSLIFWCVIRDGQAKHHTFSCKQIENEWHRLQALFHIRQVWWIGLAALLSWMPVACIGALWGVPYLMKVYGWSNTTAGNWCSLIWIGVGLGSPVIGWVSDRLGKRCPPMIVCFSLGVIGGILFVYADSLPPIFAGIGLLFIGLAAAVQSFTFSLIKDNVPPAAFGTASGFNNMAVIIGGAVMQPAIGFILHWGWTGEMLNGVPFYTAHNYQVALVALPIASFIGILVSRFKVQETYCKHQLDSSQ